MGDPNFDFLILYFVKPHQKHDRIHKETKVMGATRFIVAGSRAAILINLVMGADINQDYFLFVDHHFKADPIVDID